jgi:predicted TIM-barrel fold metal-dependent hydrolase
MEDDFGAQQIERIGVESILVETDFPHADSHWPLSHRKVAERIVHLDAQAQHKILRGNAEKLFRWASPELVGAP